MSVQNIVISILFLELVEMNHHLYRGLDVVNVPGRYKQEDAHFYIFSYELNGCS